MEKNRESQKFTSETRSYLANTNLEKRKELGQYFTPAPLREQLLEYLPKLQSPHVLDPSAGTGEFLLSARQHFGEPNLEGWEIDPELAARAKTVIPQAKIKQQDSLQQEFSERFDVVIGNPPYFEFQPGERVRKQFADVLYGRVNIYGLFFKLGLELLKPGGWLGFVVSTSMNNGAYFSEVRKYIVNHSDIKVLEVLKNKKLFDGANQSVMIIVLQKTKNSGRHIFRKNDLMIFSEQAQKFKEELEGKRTLADLGWTVRTGRVVWNQHQDKLTDDPEAGIPLIWSSNIKNNRLQIPHENERPQYIKWGDFQIGPAIVVNRVSGSPGESRIRASLIPQEMKFVAENHTNVILPPETEELDEISCVDVVEELNKQENVKTIRKIIGNTQLSRTELKNFFPLDL